MAFELSPLPYPADALEPHMSARTFGFHHGKHHQAYVDNLNKLIVGTALEEKSLEELILLAANDPAQTGVFNNAAQVWNHTFFWHCMKPGGGGQPTGELAERIDQAFGGYKEFAAQFKSAAASRFGSGWGWLVLEDGQLKVVSTPNAGNPLTANQVPLLTADVWEHAYYLDYQNRRPDFLQAFLDHLVNWDFVAENLRQAR
jgi:Fe-Mn family superoxide dismutase